MARKKKKDQEEEVVVELQLEEEAVEETPAPSNEFVTKKPFIFRKTPVGIGEKVTIEDVHTQEWMKARGII